MAPLECPPGAPGSTPAPSTLNRRVAVRRQCRRASGPITATRDFVARSAPIVNMSVAGLALVLRQRVRRGSRLLIQMSSGALGIAYDLLVHVVHCTRQPDGKWLVGCAFARELTPSELENLL